MYLDTLDIFTNLPDILSFAECPDTSQNVYAQLYFQ